MTERKLYTNQAVEQTSPEAIMYANPAKFQAELEASLPLTTRELLKAIRQTEPQVGVIEGKNRRLGSVFVSG